MATKFTANVVGHLSLLCAFVTWYVVFTSIGFASLSQDAAITSVTSPSPRQRTRVRIAWFYWAAAVPGCDVD